MFTATVKCVKSVTGSALFPAQKQKRCRSAVVLSIEEVKAVKLQAIKGETIKSACRASITCVCVYFSATEHTVNITRSIY